jgi:hypothetical protein
MSVGVPTHSLRDAEKPPYANGPKRANPVGATSA